MKDFAPALHDTIRWLLTGKLIPKKKVPKLGYRFQKAESPKILKIQPPKKQQRLFGVSTKYLVKKIGKVPESGKISIKTRSFRRELPKILNPTNMKVKDRITIMTLQNTSIETTP